MLRCWCTVDVYTHTCYYCCSRPCVLGVEDCCAPTAYEAGLGSSCPTPSALAIVRNLSPQYLPGQRTTGSRGYGREADRLRESPWISVSPPSKDPQRSRWWSDPAAHPTPGKGSSVKRCACPVGMLHPTRPRGSTFVLLG